MVYILSCATMRLYKCSGAARGQSTPPVHPASKSDFPISIVFFYVNHKENETTEFHIFLISAALHLYSLGGSRWKLARVVRTLPPSVLVSVLPSLLSVRCLEKVMSGTSVHVAALGEKSYPLFLASAGVIFLQCSYLPHHTRFFVFCELVPIFV